MQLEHPNAVFGSYKELGDRPSWLLWCIKLSISTEGAEHSQGVTQLL